MEVDDVVQKNMDLHAEWMRYVFDHPDVLSRIPPGATLVILPTDDPPLAAINQRTVDNARQRGIPVVIVRMKSPVPCVPTIEVCA